MKFKVWIVVTGFLAFLWIILGAAFNLGGVISGVVLGFVAVYPFREMYDGETSLKEVLHAIPHIVIYLVIFIKDVIIANIEVAWLILSPSLPIDPKIVEVPLKVESDYAITTIANSITLTPGTLTMDYDKEKNALYVHSISGEEIIDPIRTWERYAIRIFESVEPDEKTPGRNGEGGVGETSNKEGGET